MTHVEFSDLGDADEFFRRGDEYSATSNSLEPPSGRDVAISNLDDEVESAGQRTSAQEARRQKFARSVSIGMTVLALGTAGALLGRPHAPGSETALAVTEARLDTDGLAQPLVSDVKLAALQSPIPPSTVVATVPASLAVVVVEPIEQESAAASSSAAGNSHPEKSTLMAASSSGQDTRRPVAVTANTSAVRVSSPKVTRPKPTVLAKSSITTVNLVRPAGYQPPTVSFSD